MICYVHALVVCCLGLRIYFAIYVQRVFHQAICIYHGEAGVYIHETSGELIMEINCILEMWFLLWSCNHLRTWPGSCPQSEYISEASQLDRKQCTQPLPSINNTCPLLWKPENEQKRIHLGSGLTAAQRGMLSQSQRRGRMRRTQAAVNEKKNCWVSLTGSVL